MVENDLSFQVIESLLLNGFTVVEIFNPVCHQQSVEYFIVIKFDPKTATLPISTIKGMLVTDLVKSGSIGSLTPSLGVSNLEKQNILTKVGALKELTIEFSSEYAYKWYKSVKVD